MTSVLRLEDFAAPLPEPANPQDERLAAEYQRGLTDGETRARDLAISELTDALHAVMEALETGDALRQRIIDETLNAVTPVLQAIVVQLAASADDRLVAAIMSELRRLGTGGEKTTCRISAPARLTERITDQLDAASLGRITLLPGPDTEICFEGGRITINPDELTRDISETLSEITRREEN
ncbi:hypothetical protein [Paracoccus sp. SCSIO 75233]|uniref:hypothetical protein n=1 Tax=Paracoccus sp. SCSIO 75233 TaxID=3017782 RepID=UPI0022F0263C|nr:hypothetical protein [Paracoccus sp. SCSIO 75233]WBU53130.1 hypothetical protein PAF12_15135 [Paracoccus sp. SCSIO 75233]